MNAFPCVVQLLDPSGIAQALPKTRPAITGEKKRDEKRRDDVSAGKSFLLVTQLPIRVAEKARTDPTDMGVQ